MKSRDPVCGIDTIDDGPRLASANAFLAGRVPFRDFLISYGVLHEVVKPLVAFRIWGVTYEAYRRLGPWLSGVSVFLLFLTMAQGSQGWVWACIVGALLLFRDNWYIPDRILFEALAVFLLCRAFRTRRKLWAAAAGAATVGALLYSLEVGIVLIGGVGAYFVLSSFSDRPPSTAVRFRPNPHLGPWIVGAAGTLSAFLIWTATQGAFLAFWSDMWHVLLHRGGTWADGLPSHFFAYWFIKHRQSLATYASLHQIPLLATGTLAYLFWKRRLMITRDSSRWDHGLLLATIVLFQFFIYIGRSDFVHWKTATAFVVPLAAFILQELFEWDMDVPATGQLRSLAAWGLIIVLSIPYWNALVGGDNLLASIFNQPNPWKQSAMPFSAEPGAALPRRWGRLPADSAALRAVAETVSRIQAAVPPGSTFYDFSNQGVFYFLTERQNPTRFGMVDVLVDRTLQAEFYREMTLHPPAAVIADAEGETLFTLEELKPVRDYLLAHFTRQARLPWGSLVLLVRKTSGATRR